MLKLKFNLLPPRIKKEIAASYLAGLLISLSVWMIVCLAVFTAFLASAYLYLSILLNAQEELIAVREADEKAQKMSQMEETVKKVNQRLGKICQKQNELTAWTPFFEIFSSIVPDGVYLTHFTYQGGKNQAELKGYADTRENLLLFQKGMEENICFKDIEAPLSNLIKKTDIAFSFSLKPACASYRIYEE